MNRDHKIYLALGVIILLIIAGIFYYKSISQQTPEEETIKCIAEKVTLYSQTDCIHCKQQKQILGEYIKLFNIIECDKQIDICIKNDITGTPTWEINKKFYSGVKSIKELSDIAGCECKANIKVIKNQSIETCNINSNQQCTEEIENICTK